MPEWSTYTLADFLLFSPRTYYRLFELHHRALWPLQLAALSAGALMLVLAARGGRRAGGGATVIAAAAWLWVAWSWQFERYATINWAAGWFAAVFALEGLLLAGSSLATGVPTHPAVHPACRSLGLGLVVFALVLQPVAGLLAGRSWFGVEVFGITPAPTVVATLGLLLARQPSFGLALVPLSFCLLDGATLWAMAAPDAWVLPLIGLVAVGGFAIRRPRRKVQSAPRATC
jgi:hypothetical protein